MTYSRRLACGTMALAILAACPAQGQPVRSVLPIPQPEFLGEIRESMAESRPSPYLPVRAPPGAPNIFLFMADDVGFSMSSTFGGPVPTPNMDRLAAKGQRYNRFHTAGVCSPSRAALLTGRNPHRVGTGHISDLAAGYPGYNAHFPASAATIAQTLRLNGYSTAMFGKHHNVPPGQYSDAGPFDMWPTGLGFEYFYGFPHGESDQLRPNVYRGTSLLPQTPGPPELFERRMAEDAMHWVHNHIAAAPNKPFFIYYSPGSIHAPHQAPPELVQRFKGKFDIGWDKLRKQTFQRQRTLGIIPEDAKLTPRPEGIAAWDSLTTVERAYALRGMEVAAAMLAYQDEQLGRVLDEMERTGVLDDTLVVVIQGDNGASGDGDKAGLTDEMFAMNFVKEDAADLAANIENLGGELSHGSYAEGWGWAMNTPFPWYKSHAGMLGALRDGMIVSWKGRIAEPGNVCDRFGHLVDIAPTLLDAAKVPAPKAVFGVEQMSLDGVSLLDSLSACTKGPPRTQYFEVGGKAGLYSDGWMLSIDNDEGWQLGPETGESAIGNVRAWKLYDLNADFSQSRVLTNSQLALVLMDNGLRADTAGSVIGLFAAGTIAGRLLAGAALDRFPAEVVGSALLSLPAVGMLLLASPFDDIMILACALAIIGFAFGAEGDVLAYIASRHFGLDSYGTVLGFLFGAAGAAGMIGALILSQTLQTRYDYDAFLIFGSASVLVGSLMLLGLRLSETEGVSR